MSLFMQTDDVSSARAKRIFIYYGALAIEIAKKLDSRLFFQNRRESRFLSYSTARVDRADGLKDWTSGADILSNQGPRYFLRGS